MCILYCVFCTVECVFCTLYCVVCIVALQVGGELIKIVSPHHHHQEHFVPMHVMAMEKFMIPVEICNEEPVCGGATHDPPTVPPHY